MAFGVGAACVGAAGTFMLLLVDVQPYLGGDYTLLSFIIVIIGGLGSMPGALSGGLLVGVSEGLSAFYVAPSLKSLFSYRTADPGAARPPAGLLGAAPMTTRQGIALTLLAALLVAAPYFVGEYVLSVLIVFLLAACLGQCWNIMMGFAGQLSLGHALYYGLGAYTAGALCAARHRLPGSASARAR